MDGIGVVLVATLVGILGVCLWWRRRQQRLRVTYHSLRCPMHDDRAEVAVTTDPAAPSGRQYLGVTSCSVHSNVAIGLQERFAFLSDSPPCRVRLEPARSTPVYTDTVPCRADCVFVLNATAVSGVPQTVECTSGASDAIALAEQALGRTRMSRLLWYASL
jgi:hypothetical protein